MEVLYCRFDWDVERVYKLLKTILELQILMEKNVDMCLSKENDDQPEISKKIGLTRCAEFTNSSKLLS